MSFWSKLKYAFSVESNDDDERLPECFDRFSKKVVEKGMESPVIFLLELCKPFNFVTSQCVHAAAPIGQMLGSQTDLTEIATALESRESIGKLVEAIEERRDSLKNSQLQ